MVRSWALALSGAGRFHSFFFNGLKPVATQTKPRES